MTFRQGHSSDVEQLRLLGLASWEQFQPTLTADNWQKLFNNLNRKETYQKLLEQSQCVVCAGSGCGAVFVWCARSEVSLGGDRLWGKSPFGG